MVNEGSLTELSIFFINAVFQIFLVSNIDSEIPCLILREKEFCYKITSESLSLLLFYSKIVTNLNKKIQFPDEISESLKLLHLNKLHSIKTLNLEENPYLSTRSCKEKFLEILDNQWRIVRLRSPKEFVENEFFEVLPGEGGYFQRNSKKISIFTQNFYRNIRAGLKDFELSSLDDFYGDFLLKLASRLPKLEHLNVNGLNLGDGFCEDFNRFLIK